MNNKILLVFPLVVFVLKHFFLDSFAFPDSFDTDEVVGDKTVVVWVGFGNYEA